jgi:hypothetical protein
MFENRIRAAARTTDTVHSDATRVGSWELFRLNCTR